MALAPKYAGQLLTSSGVAETKHTLELCMPEISLSPDRSILSTNNNVSPDLDYVCPVRPPH